MRLAETRNSRKLCLSRKLLEIDLNASPARFLAKLSLSLELGERLATLAASQEHCSTVVTCHLVRVILLTKALAEIE